MVPGIFESSFPRPTLGASLDAVAALDVFAIQLDLASAGLGSLPADVPPAAAAAIRGAARERGMTIAAVGGMFNLIDPDPTARANGLAALGAVIAAAAALGTRVVTLCTGTRHPTDMWRGHPENATPAAWADLRAALDVALTHAAAADVILGIEPEPANVVANAALARRLLDEVADPRLRIVLDPANIVAGDLTGDPAALLSEAFARLGPDIILGHAKDITATGEFCAAGAGIVPWEHTIALFREAGYPGPLILHTVEEADAARAVGFLRDQLSAQRPTA